MKIKQAVNRIFWRFGGNGNKKPFPVNQEDADALNRIIEYVEEKEKQQFEANELFAKMFIYTYMRVLDNDNESVLNTHSRKKIYNLLKKPITQIIEDFTRSLNERELISKLEALGIELKHPALVSDKSKEKNTEILKEAIKKPKNPFNNVYEYDFVEDVLISEVNQAIELFRK